MNILFVFSRHAKDPKDSTLTKDLAEAFSNVGDNVYVATMNERRNHSNTSLNFEYGMNVLRVKTGNYFGANKFEKILTIITMPFLMRHQIKKHFKNIKFDLILTHTPFMSGYNVIHPLKSYYKCRTHLLLWDVFPQGVYDIGLLHGKLLFRILKYFEIKMLNIYDNIWCMSDGGITYMKKHYPMLCHTTISRLYNTSKIQAIPKLDRAFEREKLGFHANDFISIFGGNMGKPQCLENILLLAKKSSIYPNSKFIFVGSGTETTRIQNLAKDMNLANVIFYPQVTRDEYKIFVAIADLGVVSLDGRLTIPSFPSKSIDYFANMVPVLASLDSCSADDYGNILVNVAKAGVFALASDEIALFNKFKYLYDNPVGRIEMGKNGREFYEKELDVRNSVKTIKDAMNKN